MKKTIPVIITTLAFLNNTAFGFMEALEPPRVNFGPQDQLRPVEQQDFGKPNYMVDILPNRPIAARDKYGNRLYFTPGGGLTVKVNVDGSQEFSLSGKTIKKDVDGNVIEISEREKGTNRVIVKTAAGEKIGHQELGLGGKVMSEYDYEGNKVKSYKYDKYGKNVEHVLDELTMTKTIFNATGQAVSDEDFEGNKVARYTYDNQGRMKYKEDVYGNKTYFNKNGNLSHTESFAGAKIVEYAYKKDANGNTILEKSVDISNMGATYGDITYYKNGKPVYTTSSEGVVVKDYCYDGVKLAYTFDRRTNETTYYDINSKALYTTFNEYKIKEWIYYKGQLMGFYNEHDNTVQIYQHQRDDIKIQINDSPKPTGEMIKGWYEKYFNDLKMIR